MSETPRSYPDMLEVKPLQRPPVATVRMPGSKSITNRALVLAALCSRSRRQRIEDCLWSEDTEVMIESLRRLGFPLEAFWDGPSFQVIFRPSDRPHIPAKSAELFVGNSGTTMRFLTAMVGLGSGQYRLDGIPRMRERPIADLLDALQQLGVNAYSELGNGCPPVIVEADGMRGGRVRVRGDVSSQFLSAILMVAPFAQKDTIIEVEGTLVSEPYVNMTVQMMREWQLQVEMHADGGYVIPGNQPPDRIHYSDHGIEPDASAASYFFAAAAVTGGTVGVDWLTADSIQGDVHFADVIEMMGCRVERNESNLTVFGGPLHGIDVDMNAISDTVMTLAAVACFADGPTTIRNVAHIRHKETDRLKALATELRRVGAEVEEFADGLTITPRPLHGAEIETYNDHRMAMSMALIGLRVPGIVIKNPGCVAKTYPGFWEDLETLRS